MREYVVVYEKGEEGWGAYAPDLPGFGASAATLDEVKVLFAEGLEFHLESLLIHGDPIPEPVSQIGRVMTCIVEDWSQPLKKSA